MPKTRAARCYYSSCNAVDGVPAKPAKSMSPKAARYGQGEGERALSAALMRRDVEARLREVNGLAVVAKAKGVPVCLVELLRFALWSEADEQDLNLRWMMEFQGAVAHQQRTNELAAAE